MFRWRLVARNEPQRPIDPPPKVCRFSIGRSGDINESAQWPAGKVHGAHVSIPHHARELVGNDADDEIVAGDTAAHPSAAEERQTPEHPFLGHIRAVIEKRADARGELFVVCHATAPSDYAGKRALISVLSSSQTSFAPCGGFGSATCVKNQIS